MKSFGIQRLLELFLVVFFLLVVTGTIFYVSYPETINQIIGYTGCTIYDTFGIKCPTCGGTRALSAVLQGELASALHYNALVVLSVPFLLYYGMKVTILVVSGASLTKLRVNTTVLWLWLFLAVLFTITRNLVTL